MEFKINAGNFRNYVNAVSSVCNKTTLPLLNNILLEHDGEKLCLSGTNLAQSVYTEIKDIPGTPGKCTAPAKKLAALLGSLSPDCEITVTTDDEKGFVDIKTATGKFSLLGLPAVDFPTIVPLQENDQTMVVKNFADILATCASAISKDDGRAVLTGLFLELKGGFLNAVATDGKRMAVTSCIANESHFASAIVPQNALPLISKLAGDEITAYIADAKLVCVGDNMTVVTKLIAGSYPNWKAVVPASFKHSLTVDAELLANSVKLVSSVVETEKSIHVMFDNNIIRLNAKSELVGMGYDEIPVDFHIDFPLEICLNPRYLLDAIAGCKGDISIWINDVLSPVCIKRNEDAFTILMPIRAK